MIIIDHGKIPPTTITTTNAMLHLLSLRLVRMNACVTFEAGGGIPIFRLGRKRKHRQGGISLWDANHESGTMNDTSYHVEIELLVSDRGRNPIFVCKRAAPRTTEYTVENVQRTVRNLV